MRLGTELTHLFRKSSAVLFQASAVGTNTIFSPIGRSYRYIFMVAMLHMDQLQVQTLVSSSAILLTGSSKQCFQGGRSSVTMQWAWSRFVRGWEAPGQFAYLALGCAQCFPLLPGQQVEMTTTIFQIALGMLHRGTPYRSLIAPMFLHWTI